MPAAGPRDGAKGDGQVAETQLLLVRHAPALHGGRLCGRRDVPADTTETPAIAALRARLATTPPELMLVSPARRCLWTACMLPMADHALRTDPRLIEQDFGAWEGIPFADLPDLGPLPAQALATHRPPGGESFTDMAARARPVFESAQGRVAIVAHAGTVRAALTLAVGPAAALAFAVAPLSLTILTRHGEQWRIDSVNEGGVK